MLEPIEASAILRCYLQCSYETIWPFQLDHHIQTKHRIAQSATKLFQAEIKPERYSCLSVSCGFKNFYKLHLYEHYKNEHGVTSVAEQDTENCRFNIKFENWSCYFCKYKGHSSLSLCMHHSSCELAPEAQSFNLNDGSGNSKSKKYCRKSRDVLKHEHAAGGSKWVYCSECPYRTKVKGSLKCHMVTHAKDEEINWFACAICSYRAKFKKLLKRHVMTRHAAADEINWFNCSKCSYRAKVKANLEQHMLTHAPADKINWFSCAQCFYRGKRKGDLKQHMLLRHTTANDIAWFNCGKCSLKFKVKGSLTRHMLTHAAADEINWFNCVKCSFRAKRKGGVKQHMQLTHGEAKEIN